MRHLVTAALLIAAVIHLLPLAGVLGPERLAALYGVDAGEPNIQILMRHRAVLFGLLGALLAAAAFRPALQGPAFIGGFASVLSFLWLAWAVDDFNAPLQRVVVADLAALVVLLAGAAAWACARRTG
ncbi:MAG: phosphopantetheine adenylyltransferase [Comamonadaceae bacterium]|nr:MAG: phosphopantetheine adenylyltransferase [Comamonadaceae bacterium]